MSVDEHGVVEIREEGGEGSAWLARLARQNRRAIIVEGEPQKARKARKGE